MSSVRETGLVVGVRELLAHCSPRRRKHLRAVLVLMFVGAFAELATIGAVLPFLTFLTAPERALAIGPVAALAEAIGASTESELILIAAILFAVVAIAAGAVRLLLIWSSQSFVFRFGHELGVELQRRVLHQPYTYHVMQNSSQAVAALEKINALVFNVTLPVMVGVSSILISLFIIAGLLAVDWFVALVSAGSFCIIYLGVSRFTRAELSQKGDTIGRSYAERVQAVQESSGAIRDILLDEAQPIYLQHFSIIDQRLRHAQTVTSFIAAAPRFVMETAGMLLIAGLALLLSGREGGIAGAIPVLGALALGAQRVLPLLQQVYTGWVQLKGHETILSDVLATLRLPLPSRPQVAPQPLGTSRAIELCNVSYSYPGRGDPVLVDVNLDIPAGSKVALIGTTGSGKSTMIDLLMGLLEPTSGRISVDGATLTGERLRAWQSAIAHVPQSIFLADTTLARNIAFGTVPESIDMDRVRAAAAQAQLSDFIETLPDGYETSAGERGVRLSGGQRQRLGLARALYKHASVLVLDEATSALDEETETRVMRSLEGLDERLTIIMIAHRLSTVANCDLVVRLEAGRITGVGSYDQVVTNWRFEAA